MDLADPIAGDAAGAGIAGGVPRAFQPCHGRRLRIALNIPYLLLVLAFVGYDAFQTIRSGGTVHVPGGVGPGGSQPHPVSRLATAGLNC
nr:hypothetical protein [Mycobacterium riyadhense]